MNMIVAVLFPLALCAYTLKIGDKWMDFVCGHMGYDEKASLVFVFGLVVIMIAPVILAAQLGVLGR